MAQAEVAALRDQLVATQTWGNQLSRMLEDDQAVDPSRQQKKAEQHRLAALEADFARLQGLMRTP